MSATPLTEREEFEAWAMTQLGYGSAGVVDYAHGATRNAWKVWQAARASALLPLVGVVQVSQPRGTDAQILKERELTCAAAVGAMAFGSFGHAPPPAGSEWLRPFWQAGRDQADLSRDAIRYRLVRRGQHWSVVDGIGNDLRGDVLDAAIDSVSSIRSDRQEAVPHEKAPVPASSPVAPQAEPVAWPHSEELSELDALDLAASNLEKQGGVWYLADAVRRAQYRFAAPQGDGLLRQLMGVSGDVTKLLASLCTAPQTDKQYDADVLPRDLVMARVQDIRVAMDKGLSPAIVALRAALPSATKD